MRLKFRIQQQRRQRTEVPQRGDAKCRLSNKDAKLQSWREALLLILQRLYRRLQLLFRVDHELVLEAGMPEMPE